MINGTGRKLIGCVWMFVLVVNLSFQTASRAEDYFLFTSFRGNGEDGLR
jgi:hypothetical protein